MPERKVTISTTAPANPNTGDSWIHATTRVEKLWDGSDWEAVSVTKEICIPVYSILPLGILIDGGGESTNLKILIPQDFTSITALEVIFCPQETGANMHFSCYTSFGAYNGGENYNAGAEAGSNRDIGATTSGQNLAHDISDLVTGLAAGDFLAVAIDYSATAIDSNAYIRGIRLKYN